MARPRQPTVLHDLKGTGQVHPERMRARGGEPVPFGGVGECPERLAEIAEAWDYLVGCAAPGVLTSMDKVILSQAAALLTLFWQKPLEFDAKYHGRLETMLGRMGMSPSDRSKVVVPKEQKAANPFAKFRSQ